MILITGASSGIGKATAEIFAKQKCNLHLIARREDRLKKLAGQLHEQYGVDVSYSALDLRSKTAIEKWANEHQALLPTIEVLINNAGLAKGSAPIHQGNPEDWEMMIQTNIMGLLRITRVILPHMVAKKSGHVVNLGSVAGHYTYPNGAVYCSSKFAVRALNEGMRLDLNGTGVRVTAIDPGMVETEFSLVRLDDAEKAKAVYAGMKPLVAMDIAETISWCVNRPPHVNIQEVIMYPTDQASPMVVSRKT